MRIPMFRALAVVLAATASAAYAGDGSTADTATQPLGVDMECPSWSGGVYTCQAYANGGSGAGYTFTWSNSNGYAWESYDEGGYSEADAACYGGLGPPTTSTVTATVMDSNGRTASKSRIMNCGY